MMILEDETSNFISFYSFIVTSIMTLNLMFIQFFFFFSF